MGADVRRGKCCCGDPNFPAINITDQLRFHSTGYTEGTVLYCIKRPTHTLVGYTIISGVAGQSQIRIQGCTSGMVEAGWVFLGSTGTYYRVTADTVCTGQPFYVPVTPNISTTFSRTHEPYELWVTDIWPYAGTFAGATHYCTLPTDVKYQTWSESLGTYTYAYWDNYTPHENWLNTWRLVGGVWVYAPLRQSSIASLHIPVGDTEVISEELIAIKNGNDNTWYPLMKTTNVVDQMRYNAIEDSATWTETDSNSYVIADHTLTYDTGLTVWQGFNSASMNAAQYLSFKSDYAGFTPRILPPGEAGVRPSDDWLPYKGLDVWAAYYRIDWHRLWRVEDFGTPYTSMLGVQDEWYFGTVNTMPLPPEPRTRWATTRIYCKHFATEALALAFLASL